MIEVVIAVVSAATTSAVLLPALYFLLQKWIGARLEQSIKHEYDLQLESLRQEVAVRNKAALVADLLSEWLSRPEDGTKLNRLTFEAFLWLPSNIANDLSSRLANKQEAPDVRTILIQVRKHLLGSNDTFDAQKINIFLPKAVEKTP